MSVAAVVGRDAIIVIEMRHDTSGAGFLAGIQVNETGDLAGGELHMQAFFEIADGAHHGVGMQ
ncbi:hypothetical protein PFLmoz3_00816 [Pseudomonas fluorescens]|uniref:Uncharacterized protein n=1 Tax=Pseudomonas fluorescens TaxID=294 RepID=A0A109LKE0_PSEFL|nr:hypothetical protein PFLmoz3_00816 [Pseudomonas fluorescens]